MKKIKRLLPLVVILGLLAALPASAQVEATQDEGGSNLALLITINRLELTADQMQQIRDVLVGVLNEANALTGSRNAFEQEMLRFDGTGEELDALVEAFREQQTALASVLQETAQSALEDLKGILTLKQGEILGGVFDRLLGLRFGAMALSEDRFPAGPLAMRGRAMGETFPSEMREQVMERLRERLGEEGIDAERARQFPFNRPGMQGRVTERDWRGSADVDPANNPFVIVARSNPFAGLALQRGALGDRLLSRLEQVIEILNAKLQLIG